MLPMLPKYPPRHTHTHSLTKRETQPPEFLGPLRTRLKYSLLESIFYIKIWDRRSWVMDSGSYDVTTSLAGPWVAVPGPIWGGHCSVFHCSGILCVGLWLHPLAVCKQCYLYPKEEHRLSPPMVGGEAPLTLQFWWGDFGDAKRPWWHWLVMVAAFELLV